MEIIIAIVVGVIVLRWLFGSNKSSGSGSKTYTTTHSTRNSSADQDRIREQQQKDAYNEWLYTRHHDR